MYTVPVRELLRRDAPYPLHKRWHGAPEQLLKLLLRQVRRVWDLCAEISIINATGSDFKEGFVKHTLAQ